MTDYSASSAAWRRSRELAVQLADRADAIASTLESAARLHDAMAADENHPLRDEAAEHAIRERKMAASEREEARRLRLTTEV